MFICDDASGATLSAMLDRRAVVVTASHQDSRQLVALELSAATIRGMIEELTAMADELDTEQIAAEIAAADTEEAAAALADPDRFCRTCGFYHTLAQAAEAARIGECPRWAAAAEDTADMYPSTEGA